MSAAPQLDPFEQAAQDSQHAILTFLPSLGPQPVPPAPRPMPQMSPQIKEGIRAMSIVNKVEMSAKRMARGLPPEPPPPPSPQETFPPAIDQVHIRALQTAIAAHPETARPALIHEAHQNIAKWIMAQNGQIVVDGKMQIANNPGAAENLAAKIINEAVDDHDERDNQQREAIGNAGEGTAGRTESGTADNVSAVSGRRGANQDGRDGSPRGRNQHGGGDPALPPIGSTDPGSGRPITQSSTDLDTAQDAATAAAPELKDTLGQVEDSVLGAKVEGVREEKDPDRAQQKVDVDDKPVETQTDLLAGRIAVDSPEAKDAAVQSLKDSAPVIDEEDNFDKGDPDYGFRSHTLQVGLGDGKTSAEVQVVPKEIADVDDETHDTYEEGREAEAAGDDNTAQSAMDKNKKAHDAAMDKFNDRNSDRPGRIVKALQDAGFKVRGTPIKIGGHSFVPVMDDDEEES